jgi:hypothetical protein
VPRSGFGIPASSIQSDSAWLAGAPSRPVISEWKHQPSASRQIARTVAWP